MADIIHNISRVDQAVCWPDFTAPYSTKPSAELSSCFRLTLSCCSTTSTVDEVQRYARYAIKLVIYALVHVMLSYLLWVHTVKMREESLAGSPQHTVHTSGRRESSWLVSLSVRSPQRTLQLLPQCTRGGRESPVG